MSVNPPEGTLTIENSHLDVKGNVSAVALKLGTLRLTPSYGLDAVANVSNSTTHTLELSNATTGLVTTSNLEVGGDVHIRGTTFIKANINSNNIAIGTEAGETSQGNSATALGWGAGQTSQGNNATAVGRLAGEISQGNNATAVGVNAGQTTQGESAVAVGRQAGKTSQGNNATAVGNLAGEISQGTQAVAVGWQAGKTSQGDNATAVGRLAGQTNQGTQAVAVGNTAGQTSQGTQAVAVGLSAGQSNQGNSATAVGYQAGQNSQGNNAVAVGYAAGQTSQHANSIVLNASGSALNTAGASRTYIKPLQAGVVAGNMMAYDSTSGEVINYTGVSVNASGNMDVSGDLTAGCPVYFSVKKDTDSDFGTNTDLVFPDVRTNKGSGYNSSDGIFTAPIAGKYFFIFTASTKYGSDNNIVKFKTNGAGSHSNNRSDSDSNDVDSMGLHDIINLDVDETVNVSFKGHLSNAPTYFSGFYLSS
jgi:hypothetical protein